MERDFGVGHLGGAVGGHRIRHRLQRAADPRRARRRHARPSPHLHRRPCRLSALFPLAGSLTATQCCWWPTGFVQGAGAALVATAALSLITTSYTLRPQRGTRPMGGGGSPSIRLTSSPARSSAACWWSGFPLARGVPRQRPCRPRRRLPRAPRHRGPVPGAGTQPGGGPRPLPKRGRRLDVRGAVLITAAVALAVFGISPGDVLGSTSPPVLRTAVIADRGRPPSFVVADRTIRHHLSGRACCCPPACATARR